MIEIRMAWWQTCHVPLPLFELKGLCHLLFIYLPCTSLLRWYLTSHLTLGFELLTLIWGLCFGTSSLSISDCLVLQLLLHSLALPLQTFLYIWIIEDTPLSPLTLSLSLAVVNSWLSDLTISLSLSPSLLLNWFEEGSPCLFRLCLGKSLPLHWSNPYLLHGMTHSFDSIIALVMNMTWL